MASPPASTKTSLGQKLRERARQRWPQLAGIGVRFRGQFAYITGKLPDGSELPLCRLRYVGYASTWGFAIYRASHDDYQDNYLPSGQPSGTPEEALDCACGLYLGDPTAWLTPPGTDTPTDLQAGALVLRISRLGYPFVASFLELPLQYRVRDSVRLVPVAVGLHRAVVRLGERILRFL
jgi:hypothetical protein